MTNKELGWTYVVLSLLSITMSFVLLFTLKSVWSIVLFILFLLQGFLSLLNGLENLKQTNGENK